MSEGTDSRAEAGGAGRKARAGDPDGREGGPRAGFCALAGLPNVGKSTLLNRLVGADLAVVTEKPQTTRRRLRAIYSDGDRQAIFVDTPGLLEPRYRLHEAMRTDALRALREADVRVWVVDAGYGRSVEAALEFEAPDPEADLLALNKVDRVEEGRREELEGRLGAGGWRTVVPTVATEGKGVDRLREEVLRRLPESPPLYPRDQLATAPVRRFAAEFVREACFRALEEEVPYCVAVSVEEYRESEEPLYIAANVFVERESQKGIVIGEGGRMIRRIGAAARERIEAFVGRKVYLDLRVKVLPKWRKKKSELVRLGLEAPDRTGG